MHETFATLLEQCIELFGKPRGKVCLRGSLFRTPLVFESWKTTLGEGVPHYSANRKRGDFVSFVLCSRVSRGHKVGETSPKRRRMRLTKSKTKMEETISSFVAR